MRRLWLLSLGLCLTGCWQSSPSPSVSSSTANRAPQTAPEPLPQKLSVKHLPNAIRIHPKVISGGQPEGQAGFDELKDLGVKTVISVDGAKPDLDAAKKAGLRYVHLPHGYDGIPETRVKELAKAVRDLKGPIYIHCHHGKHRSPAAASSACIAAGLIAPDQALGILKLAGTSDKYRGLYQTAESARQLESKLLDELQTDFPEAVEATPFNKAMVQIEHTHDRLKQIAANGWKPTPDHPDLAPAHEALILQEHYTELLRTDHVKAQPEDFQKSAQTSEGAARALVSALEEWNAASNPPPPPPPRTLDAAFNVVSTQCTVCHQKYRDIPLSEKGHRP